MIISFRRHILFIDAFGYKVITYQTNFTGSQYSTTQKPMKKNFHIGDRSLCKSQHNWSEIHTCTVAAQHWTLWSILRRTNAWKLVKVTLSRKNFKFWPENSHLPFWQRSSCPGVEISFKIWILTHFCKVAQRKKCTESQITKEIFILGKNFVVNERWEFFRQKLEILSI